MGLAQRTEANESSRIATDLEAKGWSCCDGFLPADLITGLRDDALCLLANQEFRAAAIGTGATRAVHAAIRSDETRWIDAAFSASTAELAQRLEQLRRELNAELQLGLFELEAHFARYRPGTAYARHFDRFTGGARRVLSLVLYLNEFWRSEDGGALRLYPNAGEAGVDFSPQAGRLVLFLSERFEHEVLLTARERLSVTGWFLSRAP
jgi:SM-20-related protein